MLIKCKTNKIIAIKNPTNEKNRYADLVAAIWSGIMPSLSFLTAAADTQAQNWKILNYSINKFIELHHKIKFR